MIQHSLQGPRGQCRATLCISHRYYNLLETRSYQRGCCDSLALYLSTDIFYKIAFGFFFFFLLILILCTERITNCDISQIICHRRLSPVQDKGDYRTKKKKRHTHTIISAIHVYFSLYVSLSAAPLCAYHLKVAFFVELAYSTVSQCVCVCAVQALYLQYSKLLMLVLSVFHLIYITLVNLVVLNSLHTPPEGNKWHAKLRTDCLQMPQCAL